MFSSATHLSVMPGQRPWLRLMQNRSCEAEIIAVISRTRVLHKMNNEHDRC